MIFGFGKTNFAVVYHVLKENLDSFCMQVLASDDSVIRKRCFLVLGIKTLTADKIKELNNRTGTLVVVDCIPNLKRIQDITLLDANPNDDYWRNQDPNFKPLLKELKAKPKPLKIKLNGDETLSKMIDTIKNRSVMDKILIAAKLMEPQDRVSLHNDVAKLLAKKLSFKQFCKNVEGRGASGKKYEEMLVALQSDIAQRLSLALQEYLQGKDVQDLSSKYQVEASEIRFAAAHLEAKK